MNAQELRQALRDFKADKIDEEQLIRSWSEDNFQDLGFAKVDHIVGKALFRFLPFSDFGSVD